MRGIRGSIKKAEYSKTVFRIRFFSLFFSLTPVSSASASNNLAVPLFFSSLRIDSSSVDFLKRLNCHFVIRFQLVQHWLSNIVMPASERLRNIAGRLVKAA